MKFEYLNRAHVQTFVNAIGNTCATDDDVIANSVRGNKLFDKLKLELEQDLKFGLELNEAEVQFIRDYCQYFLDNPKCDILTDYNFEGDIESACKYLLEELK